jgi:serine/threonine protein kinase/tetratricopeptide (TPR) repeat protein
MAVDLIAAALKLKVPERAPFLNESCADADLRVEIEALLRTVESGLLTGSSSNTSENGGRATTPGTPVTVPVGGRIGPYSILRSIGRGGMGEVFLARDDRLERDVAIKTLYSTRIDPEEGLRRILREARSAARLNHPNIAVVHDVLQFEGAACIVMEFVPGQTLAELLRAGRLATKQVVEFGMQFADALVHAHAAGVIHCDLKPGNTRLTQDGQIKILDFGIARALRSAESKLASTTRALSDSLEGRPLGTPAYMSPEQILGGPLDSRTDLYSLGVILYEMAAGRRPFDAVDPLATVLAVLSTQPPELPAEVPKPLADLIFKSLNKDSGDRPASALEVRSALVGAQMASQAVHAPERGRKISRRPAFGAVLLAAALALVVAIRIVSRSASTPREPSVIAVMPFDHIGNSPLTGALASGLSEVLTTDLAMMRSLVVLPRSATLDYSSDSNSLKKVAQNLGVRYALTGTVESVGDVLHVTAGLVDVRRAQKTWTARFDGNSHDVFVLEQKIAHAVAGELNVSPDTQRNAGTTSSVKSTSNFEAFEEYAQGRELLDHRNVKGNLDRALALFENAARRDPKFALAHAGVGEASWLKYEETKKADFTEQAREETMEALRLDPNQPMIRYTLARIYMGSGKSAAAIEELQRGIATQPSSDEFHRLLGQVYSDLRRTDDAVREFQLALALRPGFWDTYRGLGLTYFNAGQYQEAIGAFKRMTELQPDNSVAYSRLGTAYQAIGDLDHAVVSYRRANELSPSGPSIANIGLLHYQQGKYADALADFEQAVRLIPNEPRAYRNLGDALTRLNEREKAKAAYQHAIDLTTARLKINPSDTNMIVLQALCAAKLGRTEDALQTAAKAASIAPTAASVLYYKAIVETYAGRLDAAIDTLREAVNRGYSRKLAREDDELVPLREKSQFHQIVGESK